VAAGCCAIAIASRTAPTQGGEAAAATLSADPSSKTVADAAPGWSSVEVAPATPGEPAWSESIPARIVFDETRASRIGAPLAGRVTQVTVQRGDRVRAGQPLFTVESGGLAELRADRAKAQLERDSAEVTFERTRALVADHALPGKELLAAQQQLADAELELKVAAQKLAALHVTPTGESSFTVTAPRDGIVVEQNLAVGQQLDGQAAGVLAIADLSVVWVVADVFEADLGTLAVGAPARVTVDHHELTGVVDQISAMVDPDRHSIPLRVKLDNRGGALRPNSHAQLRFLDRASAAVELPASAVMSDGATRYVYVRQGEALRRRDITVGSARGGKLAVLSGIKPGELVVMNGAPLLDNQLEH
jgi:RND family efflux transporter MFP subunit